MREMIQPDPLDADLYDQIQCVARAEDVKPSALLAEEARMVLLIRGGRQAVAEWEADHGSLTTEELLQGIEEAREVLAQSRLLGAATGSGRGRGRQRGA
ncbi:MAG: hypothetical protein Q8P61_09800 [Candidatus Nanopelagicales bacterium]|nr:hypothetical protein [Candidatus Nanopelagicales bacterium]